MQGMPALAGTVLAEFEPTGVVLLVLASCVCPHLALGAGELNDRTSVYFCHLLLGDRGDGPGADGAATLADGEALSDFEGDRGD